MTAARNGWTEKLNKLKFYTMKQIFLLLFSLILPTSTFAQNIDWVNAPLNPIPYGADLKYQNLKGDVFQFDYLNFNRAGRMFSYNEINLENKYQIKLDAAGRVIESGRKDNLYKYSYDTKGNLAQRLFAKDVTTYTYDSKNRIIKEVFSNNITGSSSRIYTYKKQNELLVVKELQTASNSSTYEIEKRFENGLIVYEKAIDDNPNIVRYAFDVKGNWVKQTYVDVVTKKIKYEPNTQNIIYYHELDKGAAAFSVLTEKLVTRSTVKAPILYLNEKPFSTAFTRFVNDYVLYEELSKTYYVARGAFDVNNDIGKKTPVEQLLSGSEVAMLYNGENFVMLEKGRKADPKAAFKYQTYLGNYIVKDTLVGTVFAFGRLPAMATKNQIMAVAGVNMLETASAVWYIYDVEKKNILVFDRGDLVQSTLAGHTEKDNTLVLAVNGKPTHVLTGLKNAPDKVMVQGRYFDPAKDKLKVKTQ